MLRFIIQNYKIFMLLFSLLILGCDSSKNIREKYNSWIDREIKFPDNIIPIKFDEDGKCVEVDKLGKKSPKVLVYVGKEKCYRCELNFHGWNTFLAEVKTYSGYSIDLFMYVQPKEVQPIYDIAKDEKYKNLLFIDINGDIDNLNHFEQDSQFRCFLLDENNRVVLIGNPVHNPKIKDLYIRTICEKLGKTNFQDATNNQRINLGILSRNESKTVKFEIKNTDQETLQIDSVFTSCECTTAEIDKTRIPKNESAFLSVTYTPDAVGSFYREVYVQVNGEDKTRIFAIEGKVE